MKSIRATGRLPPIRSSVDHQDLPQASLVLRLHDPASYNELSSYRATPRSFCRHRTRADAPTPPGREGRPRMGGRTANALVLKRCVSATWKQIARFHAPFGTGLSLWSPCNTLQFSRARNRARYLMSLSRPSEEWDSWPPSESGWRRSRLEPPTFGLGIQGHVSLQCPGVSIVSEIGAFCPDSSSRASQVSLWFPAVGQSTGKVRPLPSRHDAPIKRPGLGPSMLTCPPG